jgi:hypothetical protein
MVPYGKWDIDMSNYLTAELNFHKYFNQNKNMEKVNRFNSTETLGLMNQLLILSQIVHNFEDTRNSEQFVNVVGDLNIVAAEYATQLKSTIVKAKDAEQQELPLGESAVDSVQKPLVSGSSESTKTSKASIDKDMTASDVSSSKENLNTEKVIAESSVKETIQTDVNAQEAKPSNEYVQQLIKLAKGLLASEPNKSRLSNKDRKKIAAQARSIPDGTVLVIGDVTITKTNKLLDNITNGIQKLTSQVNRTEKLDEIKATIESKEDKEAIIAAAEAAAAEGKEDLGESTNVEDQSTSQVTDVEKLLEETVVSENKEETATTSHLDEKEADEEAELMAAIEAEEELKKMGESKDAKETSATQEQEKNAQTVDSSKNISDQEATESATKLGEKKSVEGSEASKTTPAPTTSEEKVTPAVASDTVPAPEAKAEEAKPVVVTPVNTGTTELTARETYVEANDLDEIIEHLYTDFTGFYQGSNEPTAPHTVPFNEFAYNMIRARRQADPIFIESKQRQSDIVCKDETYIAVMGLKDVEESNTVLTNDDVKKFVAALLESDKFVKAKVALKVAA